MKIKMFILALVAMCACNQLPDETTVEKLSAPTELKAEQKDSTSIVLTWKDNAEGEIGYRVFLRGEGDAYSVEPLEVIEADAVSYSYSGLTVGGIYDFGVQAISSDMNRHSELVYLLNYKVMAVQNPVEDDSTEESLVPRQDPR